MKYFLLSIVIMILPIKVFSQYANSTNVFVDYDCSKFISMNYYNTMTGVYSNDGTTFILYNWTNDGIVNFTKPTGETRFIGKTQQKISGAGNSNYWNVLFDNPTTADAFELNNDIHIFGNADFKNGIIGADDAIFGYTIFDDNATHTNASDSAYVDGPVKKIGNDAFSFPIGDDDGTTFIKRKVDISSPSNISDKYEAQYFWSNSNPMYPHSSKDNYIDLIDDTEYWVINQLTGSNQVSITINYNAITTPTYLTSSPDILTIVRWDGVKWIDEGGTLDLINQSLTTVPSGYGIFTLATFKKAMITNSLAWVDENEDGIRTPNEVLLPDMGVEIYDINGELYKSTATGINGIYSFDNLKPESYYLKFDIPSEYQSHGFTLSNQGDDYFDSDVTHAYGLGTTSLFELAPNENINHQDAGISQCNIESNMISLVAEWEKDYTLIKWTTTNEINTDKFKIQRSYQDTLNFQTIGEVSADNSNSYSFKDYTTEEDGIYYYRIIEVDYTCLVENSNIVSIFRSNKSLEDLIIVYPNPTFGETTIQFGILTSKKVIIDLYHINAKLIVKNIANETFDVGMHKIKLDIYDLPASPYIIMIQIGDYIVYKELIKVTD